jgi:hypothetical protein
MITYYMADLSRWKWFSLIGCVSGQNPALRADFSTSKNSFSAFTIAIYTYWLSLFGPVSGILDKVFIITITSQLRSSSLHNLHIPRCKLNTYGLRAFSVAAQILWNSLPVYLKSCATLSIFKADLKTFLFKDAYD